MDSQTVELFSRYLPPEIIAEIDNHLIALYRPTVTNACARMVKKYIRWEFQEFDYFTVTIYVEKLMYHTRTCSCGEPYIVKFNRDERLIPQSSSHAYCKFTEYREREIRCERTNINGRLLRLDYPTQINGRLLRLDYPTQK